MSFAKHRTRIITAVLALLLLSSVLILGGWPLAVGLGLFCCLALWEFYELFWPGSQKILLKILGLALCLILLVAAATRNGEWLALALLGAFWVGNLRFLFRFDTAGNDTDLFAPLIFLSGLLYIPLTMHFFLFCKPMEIILVIVAVIASDTAAFYAGSQWGKRKIWPGVSPKKSWVGSVASMTACVGLTLGLGLGFGAAPWWGYLALGIILNLGAQFGDFYESALKRKVEVKDSGTLLPGHGGMLDRVDGLLLALPLYALVRTVFPEIVPAPGFEQIFPPLMGP